MPRPFAALVAVSLTLNAPSVPQEARSRPLQPQELARLWDAEHVSPAVPPLLTHADVAARLSGLAARNQGFIRLEKVGDSVEGRAINLVSAGTGGFPVLLWSQMHGDEPTATAALFDVFEHLARHRGDPAASRILSRLTLHAIPMLNPDGAERFQRRNAQGIDINRDALRLQTPEGRTLKAVRDRIHPRIGFNLHNQSWRTSVGDPPQPASISLLSVAFDRARSESAGRTLTRKVCAVIAEALEPFASGRIGRYDDEFEVRAFGDNLTLWGTPVVLIETGAWPSEDADAALVRLNFLAILSALDALATGAVDDADPRRYHSLPINESRGLAILVNNGTVLTGTGVPPFTADIGIVATRRVGQGDGQRQLQTSMTIEDLGDLRTLGALRTIDAAGATIIPLPAEALEAGQLVDLPEWKVKQQATIAVGQPARLAVLKPAAEPGRYRVELVLR
jgi:hypothetical protein